MQESENSTRLTQYAHGAGCGCKIAPQVLQEILKTEGAQPAYSNLLVGNSGNDDAAVYDIGDGKALISTTDFFTPIVDDAFDFGRVAAANAISDVYAMGGKPLMALAILGWPVNKLPANLARRVIEGARNICAEAGIPLAGGHSIDSPEPVFGLSVNGLVDIGCLKRNNTAREGDLLFLTKPLGVGILSTAQKRGVLLEEDKEPLLKQLTTLNLIGEKLGKLTAVTAMTDITGFGLLGHLIEMSQGSRLGASLYYNAIPKMPSLAAYQGIVPDATYRNWNAYQDHIEFADGVNVAEAFTLLPDPQTNGGILFSVSHDAAAEIIALLTENGLSDFTVPIGQMVHEGGKTVKVKN